MEAGKLRHRITIKSLSTARDPYGEPTQIWNDVISLRASKDPLLGNEYFAAESAQSKVEVKFRTRYVAGIDRTMRIHHGNEVYEILSEPVNVQGLSRELLLYCRKVI